MKGTPTYIMIGLIVLIIACYDLFAILAWGSDYTFSTVILDLAQREPVVPLLVGVVLGHLFWPMRIKEKN
jgi:uncharacterized membrane protein